MLTYHKKKTDEFNDRSGYMIIVNQRICRLIVLSAARFVRSRVIFLSTASGFLWISVNNEASSAMVLAKR